MMMTLFTAEPALIPVHIPQHEPQPQTNIYHNVAVIFIDITGFVAHTLQLSHSQRIAMLHQIYSIIDGCAAQHHAQIIKYLGDGCLIVTGLNSKNHPSSRLHYPYFKDARTHAVNHAIQISIELQQQLPYSIKCAITSGNLVGGYVGLNQSQFDVWGKIVDQSARILGSTASNAIYVCHNTAHYHSLPIRVSEHHLELKDFGDTCVYQIHH
jgi:class 3 adenylate cyclase